MLADAPSGRRDRRHRRTLAPFTLLVSSVLSTALAAGAEVSSGSDADPPTVDAPTVTERITVTATGELALADGLPVSATVIGREEIEDSQEETVADLMRGTPGVTVLRSGDRGGATTFFVRGTESDHVLALFDGVRLNSPYFAGYDWSLLASAGLERIEVARGPYSALWGSDAVGGVINLIPGQGADGSSAVLVAEAGEDRWRRAEATVGWGGERVDLFASVSQREAEGRLENSDFENRQLLLDGGWSWSDGERAAVVFQDLDAELGVPFWSPGSPSPNRRQDTAQQLIAAPIALRPTARWDLELTPSRVEGELVLVDPDDVFGFVRGDTFTRTTQARLASHHDVGEARRHDVSWGGEWREDEVDSSSNFGVDLAGDVTRVRGLFAQDVWRPSDRATVIAGLRWDEAEPWGDALSPKLSLGFEVSRGVMLRASYGEAFRQPAVGELFFPFSGNRELEPERSRSVEAGIVARRGRHRFDGAVFATDTRDLIDFDTVTFAFANVDQVEIRGAEMSWLLPAGRRLDSTLSVTFLDTEDEEGRRLLRRPEWSAAWRLGGRLGGRVRGELDVLWVGERDDVDATTFARKEVPSHATGNLAVAWRLVGGLELTARVQNVADRRYEEIDGYPAPGRRVLGGVRWSR